jgi:hypothetical protein
LLACYDECTCGTYIVWEVPAPSNSFLSGESSGCTGFVWVEWSDWFICLEIRAAVPCWHPLFMSFRDLLCFIHCVLILWFWASRKVKTCKFSYFAGKTEYPQKKPAIFFRVTVLAAGVQVYF